MKQDLESTQRLANQVPKSSDNQDRFSKIDQEHQSLIKAKNQVEEDLKTQTNDMQKFQFEYEDQVQTWKKEKSELQGRIHELVAQMERLKFEAVDQVDNYKHKYSEYKQKLKKANVSIQTLTSRVAKYELALAAEREVDGHDRMAALKGMVGLRGHHQRSSEGAMSPGMYDHDGFDGREFDNQELNEEIKKLLLENQM